MFGLYKPFADLLELRMGMAKFQAWATATTIMWCIPGAFGFLVWELTANWRLYAANRWPNLSPVGIGAHGETMGRLLRPGFHSGTVPKRYAKLRRAERYAEANGDGRPVNKHMRALDHVETELRRYVVREFLELFAQSRCWQAPPPELTGVRLSTNCVAMEFSFTEIGDAMLELALEARCGRIVAGAKSCGVERLLSHQRQVLITAILALYKSAGVDLVREQVESHFPLPIPPYDFSPVGLVLWPEVVDDVEVLYDLREGSWIAPQSVRGLARRALPTLQRQQLVFGEVPVPWERWVAAWTRDEAGQALPELRRTFAFCSKKWQKRQKTMPVDGLK